MWKKWCFWSVVLEKTFESPLDCKEIQLVNPKKSVLNIHWKDWCWSWNSDTLATWCKELTHWKGSWSWERLMVGGEGDNRGRDGWMASLMQWTWIWLSSRSWWWTGKPGMLQSSGSRKVGPNWVTELNWLNNNYMLALLSSLRFFKGHQLCKLIIMAMCYWVCNTYTHTHTCRLPNWH